MRRRRATSELVDRLAPVIQPAEFYRLRAAKMRETARGAPNTSLRKMFEDIATEYDKLAEREDDIVR